MPQHTLLAILLLPTSVLAATGEMIGANMKVIAFEEHHKLKAIEKANMDHPIQKTYNAWKGSVKANVGAVSGGMTKPAGNPFRYSIRHQR